MIELAGQLGKDHSTLPIPMSAADIADDLTARIRSGEYVPGTRLPMLKELADLYSVHTATIQRALGKLKDAGLVVTVQGHGMYVVEQLPPAPR